MTKDEVASLCKKLWVRKEIDWDEAKEDHELYAYGFAEEIATETCNIAQRLGVIGDKRAVRPLIRLLKGDINRHIYSIISEFDDEFDGDDYETIITAAEALGNIGDERAVNPLIELLTSSRGLELLERGASEVWIESISALGRIGDKRAVKPLIELLENDEIENIADLGNAVGEDTTIHIAITEALEMLGNEHSYKSNLKISKERKKRVAHDYNLGKFGIHGDEAFEIHLNSLYPGDYSTRSCAVEALGKIGDKRAVEPLLELLDFGLTDYNDDEEERAGQIDLRISVAQALGKIGDKRAVEPLLELLDDVEYKVRKSVIDALKKIGDKRAVKPLIRKLKDRAAVVRISAAKALGTFGDKRAVEPLIKLLEVDDSGVQHHAILSLEKLGDKRAIGPIIEILSNKDKNLRVCATNALIVLDVDVESLIKVIGGDSRHLTQGAAVVLGKIGKPAVKHLIGMLGNKDPYVMKSVVWALTEIGEPAVKHLIKSLAGDNHEVRKAATNILGEIGDKRAVKPLVKALEDENEDILKSTLIALKNIDPSIPDIKNISMSDLLSSDDSKLCEQLLGNVLELDQENFARIIEEKSSFLGTVKDYCDAEKVVEFMASSSPQARWLVACAVVELSNHGRLNQDKLFNSPEWKNYKLFVNWLPAYRKPIRKKERDEIAKAIAKLPSSTLQIMIGINLNNDIIQTTQMKDADKLVKENAKMLTTVFEDPKIAKSVLSGMD